MTDPRRQLPSVDAALNLPGLRDLLAEHPRDAVVAAVRHVIGSARAAGGILPEDLVGSVRELVKAPPSLRPVVNATGVVLHTNLGRAPLARQAAEAALAVATGYATLEYRLAAGERGSRHEHCSALLASLAGAEDGLAVVNGAGALVLALNAVAEGREVILSRGELIEIGGSFRLPDILAKAGCVLHEVGTTNRTHLADYERAITPATGAILTVHRSNFRMEGFTSTPAPEALAGLAHRAQVPYLVDVGGGLLHDLSPWGLRGEPGVRAMVACGADAVIFSGDKLLGGPQAGCIAGTRATVARCRANPIARAMRCDKVTLAALQATLRLHGDLETARREIPVLAMLTAAPDALAASAEHLRAQLAAAGVAGTVEPGSSAVGGGAFPEAELPTSLVVLSPGDGAAASRLARRLRLGEPAVIARVQDDRVLLDPRTIPAELLAAVARAVALAAAP